MKIKNIIYAVCLTLVSSACSKDYLDTLPESSVGTATIFESAENAKLAINGICKMMTTQYLSTQGLNGEGSIKNWYGNYSGNDTQKSNLTGWATLINMNYFESANSTYLTFPWYYYYKMIGNANAVIVNFNEIADSDPEKADKQFIKAQALTFRAYAYSQLARFYCYRWSDTNNGATRGLPLRLDDSVGDLEASTVAETYAQIYADLDEAIQLYEVSGKDREAGDLYSPNLSVAYGVYARAALNREDWTNAAKYAPMARKGYPLMSNADYNAGFSKPTSEWIWEVYDASDQTLYYYSWLAYLASNSNASVCRSYPFAISRELIEQIPESDIRRNLFLVPQTEDEWASITTSSGRTSSGALYKRAQADYASRVYSTSYIFAYMHFKFLVQDNPGVGEQPIFRSAEMYYIEAEAKCHLGGNDASVQDLLYELTNTTGRDPEYQKSTKTGADLLEEVKLYRRFDLWGEGFDFFDYKRWGQPISRKTYDDGGNWHATFAVTIEPSDKNKWTMIYPKKETDYNKAVTAYPKN
ncbi:MAG: RagB/SusD family nutrient uptake outer membrane protein [Bacteroidales bacterium]|nr:RagB/SusD family nutrient uptake outer membrane protein [Bacteroidales bacterium]